MRIGVFVGLLSLVPLPGCTVAGMGIGSIIDGKADRFESTACEQVKLERGQTISVRTTRGERLVGTYEGRLPPRVGDFRSYLVVRAPSHGGSVVNVPEDEIAEMGVKVPKKGWLYGTIAGAVVDTVLIVGTIVAVATFDMEGLRFGDADR